MTTETETLRADNAHLREALNRKTVEISRVLALYFQAKRSGKYQPLHDHLAELEAQYSGKKMVH